LNALLAQETDLEFEIIVIDNNSSDNTFSLLKQFSEGIEKVKITLLFEENSGKVNALKKGVLSSTGDLVIICDDDNYLTNNFLEVAYEFFIKNPVCGAACGHNSAISDIPFPDWFNDYKILYGCGSLLNGTGEVNNLWGAGMVIRGDLIRNLYASGLKHLLGTKYENDNRYNSIRLSGEDNELCFWIKLLGHKLFYVNDLKLDHAIPAQRLTIQYRENLLKGIQISNEIFKSKNGFIKSALKKVRKKDFLNVFLPNNKGKVSRLKLGLIRKGDLYHNFIILKKLIMEQ
jgi:cellulose synthase/poly-beta-1,6-N-acetylglucosamine synthase-like glycosyltransferase